MSENIMIVWSDDTKLNWSNFKAESNPAVFEDSHSAIHYGFTWIIDSDKLDNTIVFKINQIDVTVEFNPLISWVRQSESSDNLLIHEQGHFDLAEITKRNYEKTLKKMFYDKSFPTRGENDARCKQFAKEDSGKMISIEIEKLTQIYRQKREQYDEETEYGKNIKNQSQYNEIFKKLRL